MYNKHLRASVLQVDVRHVLQIAGELQCAEMKVACLSSALGTVLRSDFRLFDTRVALRHCISIVLKMYGS